MVEQPRGRDPTGSQQTLVVKKAVGRLLWPRFDATSMSGDVDEPGSKSEGGSAADDDADEAALDTDTGGDRSAAETQATDRPDGNAREGVGGRDPDVETGWPTATEIVGAALLGVVPIVFLSVPVRGFLVVSDAQLAGVAPAIVALASAAVVGFAGSYALGPILVGRSLDKLPEAHTNDAIEERIVERAVARGLEPPMVRFVDVDAATIAVVDSLTERTVVVPRRLAELDTAARNAVIEHALVRIDSRNGALVTALLTPALLVEAWTLLGLELARRREEPEEDDRLPQMLGAGDREERDLPWIVPAAAGVLLLIAVAPLWIVFAVGDRLLVGGGRSHADDVVARAGDTRGLGDALVFARDARGDRDWPPTLDRLSLVGMADPVTQRVRGTSRIELRVRLAGLRARDT